MYYYINQVMNVIAAVTAAIYLGDNEGFIASKKLITARFISLFITRPVLNLSRTPPRELLIEDLA